MDTQNQPSEKNVKKITLGSVIAWIFSIFVGVPAIMMLFSNFTEGITLLLAALIVFPPMDRALAEKFNITLSRGIKAGAVLILLTIGSMMSSDKSPISQQVSQGSVTEKAQPATEVIKVSAIKLSEEYKANEISADAKYKGNVVEVLGVVGSIAKDIFDTPYVTLKNEEYSIVSIQCMFSKDYEPTLALLYKGYPITLSGKVSGKMGNIIIRECQVILK